MRSHLTRSQWALCAAFVATAAWGVGVAAQDHDAGAHTHAAAAAIKNPVKATPESISAGKKTYDTQCATCHGESGKGDGKMAASMNPPKPSDLTDASWKHGSSDGEIFTLVKDGAKGTGMRGYASRMKTDDIW